MFRELAFSMLPILVAMTFACGGSRRDGQDNTDTMPPILFQRTYINHAWGYQNRGWVIDQKGAMRSYRANSEDQWHFAATEGSDSGFISRLDLEENSALSETVIYQVPLKEIRQKADLISKASDGKISEPVRQAYDAGEFLNICYHWDSTRGLYKEILISRSGDTYQINNSLEAMQLDIWMNGLDNFYNEGLKTKP